MTLLRPLLVHSEEQYGQCFLPEFFLLQMNFHWEGFLRNFFCMQPPSLSVPHSLFVNAREYSLLSNHIFILCLSSGGRLNECTNMPEVSHDFFWTTTFQILWQNALSLFLMDCPWWKRKCWHTFCCCYFYYCYYYLVWCWCRQNQWSGLHVP